MTNQVSSILMVRPVKFGYNVQTAESNAFQKKDKLQKPNEIQNKALKEFDDFTSLLKMHHINVIINADTPKPHTPDSIFPNNWISFHNNVGIIIYPLLAENRRLEKNQKTIDTYFNIYGKKIDLSENEKNNRYLEGTGSMVFDYENKIAYAALSTRTNILLVYEVCEILNYTSIIFNAFDISNKLIYHTNVMMCIGNGFAVICLECITDSFQRTNVLNSLSKTHHQIIEISHHQMNCFAGNCYQLFNSKKQSFIIMSKQAYDSLSKKQIDELKKFGKILHTTLDTIEKYGGGSARCMIADMR